MNKTNQGKKRVYLRNAQNKALCLHRKKMISLYIKKKDMISK